MTGALPVHLACIMDGNGRWAHQQQLPTQAGHARGATVAKMVIEACASLLIRYVTLYAFSSENWQRSQEEVAHLMTLLEGYVHSERPVFLNHQIRFRVIGDRTHLAEPLRHALATLEHDTASLDGLHLTLAIGYGSHAEITHAAQQLAREVQLGALTPDAITPLHLARYLDTHDLPPPDLCIRTGGEQRLSNFLLWQLAYSELFFLPVLWPDFALEDLQEVLAAYAVRQRRFGKRLDPTPVPLPPLTPPTPPFPTPLEAPVTPQERPSC